MSGLLEIFYAPGKVFDRVRERSMFLPAFLALMILAAGTFAVMANMIGMETMTRKNFENNPRMAQRMTPEQMEQAINASGAPSRMAIGYAFAAVGTAIVLLIIAGVELGALSATGGKVNFKQVLGATAYAWIPFAVLRLIMTAVILKISPDRESLDFQNLIATNVGSFLDKETTGKAILSIAGSIDLISFAQIAFMAYGLSKVSRVSFGTCAAIVIGLWAVYVLGKAGVSAMF